MLDLINFIYCLFILLCSAHIFKLKKWIFIVLFFHLISIFFFNDFLFPATYMPDQFRYLETSQAFRSFDFSAFDFGSVAVSSMFFAFFPIPFLNSVYSIGMINFLLYLFLFCFFRNSMLNNKVGLIFYLFYPSLLLYSSLALRDMLIFGLMFISIYWFIYSRIIYSIIYLFPLIFIKTQNFILLFLLYLFFEVLKKYNISSKIIIMIFAPFIFYYYSDWFSLDAINEIRYNMSNSNEKELFQPIVSIFDLFLKGFLGALNFIMRPIPLYEFSIFNLFQFLENSILFIMIIYIIYQNYYFQLFRKKRVFFLNSLFFIFIFLYGLVIENSGTAARYKFPIITIYVIYSWYFIYQAKQIIKKREICVV